MHARLTDMDRNSVVSTYCPLDLFSGDEARVRKALQNLWEAWVESQGKANNLRLFVQGEMVDPSDVSSASCCFNLILTTCPVFDQLNDQSSEFRSKPLLGF